MTTISKYPKGLFFLVFTEFWERFGYYLTPLYHYTPKVKNGEI